MHPPLDAGRVRQQLRQVLGSDGFAHAPRLREFLTFVVEETLAGRDADIKEYVVGTRVYLKPASYDPRLDSTVRVEASKLRTRLQQYYKGAGRDDPVVISIPKGSYVPSISERTDPELANSPGAEADAIANRPLPRARAASLRKWAIRIVLAICVFAAAILAFKSVSDPPLPITRLFTTYAGGEYEPAFSPDGRRIAFVWNGADESNFQVYIRQVDADGLLKLTGGSSEHGSPAWSPDGNTIAYLRYGGEDEDSGVYASPALGGVERKLASLYPVHRIYDRWLDWSPAANWIAVVDRPSDGAPLSIYIVSVDSGSRRRLTTPPPNSLGDTGPAFSPDGRSVAFRRTISASVNDIYVVPILGGEPRRVTADNRFTSAHAWTADGSEIVFSSARGGALELWRMAADGGAPRPIPGVGAGANFLAIARTGGRLAYSEWFADTNIWRYGLSGGESPVPLIASTRADVSPQYSPDGKRIVFRSDRSGTNEIWVADADGHSAQRLTSAKGPLTGSPRWSPDGQWIAYDSRPEGYAQIFVVHGSGGAARQVTAGPRDHVTPSWSADGKWIYFGSNGTGSWQVWKTPADATPAHDLSVQVTRRGGFIAFESADGRYLYYAAGPDTPGLRRMPVRGGAEETVVADFKPGLWGDWAISRGALFYVEPVEGGQADLYALDVASDRTRRVTRLMKPPVASDGGLAVSADGASLLYVQPDHTGSDIMLVENFR